MIQAQRGIQVMEELMDPECLQEWVDMESGKIVVEKIFPMAIIRECQLFVS